MTSANAAILFEPDGYLLDGPKLMGRQAAGNAFLRAAVAGLKASDPPEKRSKEHRGRINRIAQYSRSPAFLCRHALAGRQAPDV